MNSIKCLFAKFLKKIQISAVRDSLLDKSARLGSASNLQLVRLGKYSYIGSYCTIVNADIGNFCSIADNCIIGGAAHTLTWVSTSPVFHKGNNILRKNFANNSFTPTMKTSIGHDVWIGNNCLIKQGVSIGNGAVIGMGSVVTKDIPSYAIVAGNPAKLIRMRFTEEQIHVLEKSKWWNFASSKLSLISDTFCDIDLFSEKLNQIL